MLESVKQLHLPYNKLTLSMARTSAEVYEAQRLRYKVFAEEMGMRPSKTHNGIDHDIFDRYCDHLLVRDNSTNKVIGTCRLLPSNQGHTIGGFHSEAEFDLTRLVHLRSRMVEVGRTCVHRDYRDVATISRLWGGLVDYMSRRNYEFLIGCASISMNDGGHFAASVYNKIYKAHLAPAEYRSFPRYPLPLESLNRTLDATIPQLIQGYLRLGAYVGGASAWNADFNTADILFLLPMSRVNAKQAKPFTH